MITSAHEMTRLLSAVTVFTSFLFTYSYIFK